MKAAPKSTDAGDLQRLRVALNNIDCIAGGALESIARLASAAAALAEPDKGACNYAAEVGSLLDTIKTQAQNLANDINVEAEEVGCNYVADPRARAQTPWPAPVAAVPAAAAPAAARLTDAELLEQYRSRVDSAADEAFDLWALLKAAEARAAELEEELLAAGREGGSLNELVRIARLGAVMAERIGKDCCNTPRYAEAAGHGKEA